MANYNSSNAYKMRYEDGAAEKRKKKQSGTPEKKHIRPNITVKLNRTKESKPVLPRKPFRQRGRSLDAGEVRLLFAGCFAFCVFIAFFAFTMKCNAKKNELTNLIREREEALASLQSDYSGLVVDRDRIFSEKRVEAYAKQNLGMQKRENHQMKWFEMSWGDDFED